MIITFHSYKGGVGCSMAVANIATILARDYGRRVIVVDWDLEAPRSHRFFGITDNEVCPGVIDFLYEYKEFLAGEKQITIDALPKLERFITLIRSYPTGKLWLMPAGKQDSVYADRVNAFDWSNFYEKWNGSLCIEYMKRELSDIADYIIVDSRTRFADMGGICTLQLPDALVLLIALNSQNVEGMERIILNLRENPVVKEMNKSIIIIPVPARIDFFFNEETIKWKQIFKERFSKYLPDYIDSDTFFNNVSIPYIAKYSFEEEIAVNIPGEDGSDPTSISRAYYKLTEYIIEISIEYFKKEIEDEKRSKIEIAQIYRKFGSLEQFRGHNDIALNCYNKALEIFKELKEEGYKPDKRVKVDIISKAFKIYEELNDKKGALQTFNDISPDPADTVDKLSECIKIKPDLRNEAANILSVVSKFKLDLVLPTLNHLADSVVPAVQDKALDILEQVVKVKPEDAVPILKRLIKFSWITSIKDRAKSILDEISSQ